MYKYKITRIIGSIIIVVGFVMCMYVAIRDNSNASHLRKVCTEVTYGSYYKSERTRITSSHMYAKYVVDDVMYIAKGMDEYSMDYNGIVIHYNPNNPSESYCGRRPVCSGVMEIVTLILLVACIILNFFVIPRKMKE